MSQINPYESPLGTSESPGESKREVASRLTIPAYGLLASLIVGWIHILGVTYITYVDLGRMGLVRPDFLALIVFAGIYAFISYVILRGFFAMLRMQDPRAALSGVWASALPCSCGCLLALPFAVWADWVLRNPEVWAAFSAERLPLVPWKAAYRPPSPGA
jgi:hypothetical protein